MAKLNLYYETAGNKADPCIVLIMGLGAQLINWPPEFTQGLADEGFYVVSFDNRDAGLSPFLDQIATPELNDVIKAMQEGRKLQLPYTLEDMAADVIGLLDALQVERAHIAGASMGGIIAQLVAIHYPSRVLSLICMETTSGGAELPPPKPEVMEFYSTQKKEDESFELYLETNLRKHRIYNHPDYVDENKLREFLAKAYQRSHRTDGFKRQLLAMITTGSRIEKLKALRMPTLIIHGDMDPVVSLEHAQHLHQCIADSRLEVIEKMGHGVPAALSLKLVDVITKFRESMS